MNIVIVNDKVIVDNVELPKAPKSIFGSNVTTANDKVYVNGYEWKNGYWKRTLKALWHLWF